MGELDRLRAVPKPLVPTADYLVRAVAQWVAEVYGPVPTLPPELRIQMHPSVYHKLAMITEPTMADVRTGRDVVKSRFAMPVEITNELETDEFRLVYVTKQVVMGGKV